MKNEYVKNSGPKRVSYLAYIMSEILQAGENT
jgi:hypothetical protein